MYEEASKRLRDADLLQAAIPFDESSDSAYLLKLLGLELLLKLIYEYELSKKAHGHKYEELFEELPKDLQTRLLSLAGERVGPSGLSSDPKSILQEWGANFVGMRYPWVRYANCSEEDYSNLGQTWISNDAPIEDATFRYHPRELIGFIAALRKVAGEMQIYTK